jgi:hypothetical protein
VEFDEDFFENPIWDADATRFATFYKEGLKAADSSKAGLADSMFKAPNLTPTAFGITNILSVIGYPGATALKGTLPALTAFFDQTTATEGSPAKTGKVNPPFLSVAEQQRGAFPIKASTIALIGAGVLAITAIVLMSKKKR